MPEGKEQASFEALLEVGQYLTLELSSKRNPNTTIGNNNWQNYFAYIYAANGENTHVAQNNLMARDRANCYDVWLNKGTKFCKDTSGSGGNISVMQVANGNPGSTAYNNAMNDAKVYITVSRTTADTVYYSVTIAAGSYKIISNFVINTTGLYGEAVEKVGVAIMTRDADVTVTSAKLYTPVTEA